MNLMLMTPEGQKRLAFAVELIWVGFFMFLIKKANKSIRVVEKADRHGKISAHYLGRCSKTNTWRNKRDLCWSIFFKWMSPPKYSHWLVNAHKELNNSRLPKNTRMTSEKLVKCRSVSRGIHSNWSGTKFKKFELDWTPSVLKLVR